MSKQCGLEWDVVTPRSASRDASGFEAIEEPRSAWMVSWSQPMFCLAMVSASNSSASSFDSRVATIHPTV